MRVTVEINLDGRIYTTIPIDNKATEDIENSIIRAVEDGSPLTYITVENGTLVLFPACIVRAAFLIEEWD